MPPHNHRGQHGHVQVRPEVPHALREARQEPRGGQVEAEQTHDPVREDPPLREAQATFG